MELALLNELSAIQTAHTTSIQAANAAASIVQPTTPSVPVSNAVPVDTAIVATTVTTTTAAPVDAQV